MSEKRFTVKEWEDVNYSEHCFYDKGNELSDEDVVKLLNSLSEKNEQLRQELEENKSIINFCSNGDEDEDLHRLIKENEQLRHWNKCLAEKRHNENETKGNLIKKLLSKIDFLERIIDGDL